MKKILSIFLSLALLTSSVAVPVTTIKKEALINPAPQNKYINLSIVQNATLPADKLTSSKEGKIRLFNMLDYADNIRDFISQYNKISFEVFSFTWQAMGSEFSDIRPANLKVDVETIVDWDGFFINHIETQNYVSQLINLRLHFRIDPIDFVASLYWESYMRQTQINLRYASWTMLIKHLTLYAKY